jgi:pimeloyl-ACP methyl ester carboxylesterase
MSSASGSAPDYVTLDDGRRLAYAEYGDHGGTPVVFFHGTQSSRLERHPDESIARGHGVRLIAIDRPGHGLSDFQQGRQMLDWPQDVAALADELGFDRFAVMGMSGGGPYTLACAYAIPERLTTATVIAAAAPMDVPGLSDHLPRQTRVALRLARTAPWVVSTMLSRQRKLARENPSKAVEASISMMSKVDQAIAARPEVAAILPEIYSEAYRLGHQGPAWDLTVLSRPWGFRPEDIRMPVTLWQGDDDLNVPVEWGRYFAATLPDCNAHFLPNAGHLLIFDHFDQILAEALDV